MNHNFKAEFNSKLRNMKGAPIIQSALPASILGLSAYSLANKFKDKDDDSKLKPILSGLGVASILPLIQAYQGFGILPSLNRFGLKGLGASKNDVLGRSDMKNRHNYTKKWLAGTLGTEGPAKKYLSGLQAKYPDTWNAELSHQPLTALSGQEKGVGSIMSDTGLGNDMDSKLESILKTSKVNFNVPVTLTKREVLADPNLTFYEKANIHRIMNEASNGRSGFINSTDITRGVIGAGLGAVGAGLFGKVFSSVFGGLSSKSQRILQGTGALAGLLRNTGV